MATYFWKDREIDAKDIRNRIKEARWYGQQDILSEAEECIRQLSNQCDDLLAYYYGRRQRQ